VSCDALFRSHSISSIMNCRCRTAALRIFVRNFTRLNIRAADVPLILHPSGLGPSRLPSNGSSSKLLSSYSNTVTRQLHLSAQRNGAAESSLATPPEQDVQYSIEETAAPTEKVEEAAEPNSKPTKPKRVRSERKKAKADAIKKTEPKKRKRDFKAAVKPDREKKDAGKQEESVPPEKEAWQIQKGALKEKFPEGWNPRKKLSPDALEGIRALNAQFPDTYTTEVIAQKFEMSPEAIRRILRSKWRPSAEEEEDRQQRWFNRGKKVWGRWAELGKHPPRRWRQEGIKAPPRRIRARPEPVHTQSAGKRRRLAELSESSFV